MLVPSFQQQLHLPILAPPVGPPPDFRANVAALAENESLAVLAKEDWQGIVDDLDVGAAEVIVGCAVASPL